MSRILLFSAMVIGLVAAASCQKDDPYGGGGQGTVYEATNDASFLLANLVFTDENNSITGYMTGFGLNEADPGEVSIPCEMLEVAGYRLSSQKLHASDHPGLERRFYGPSLYFAKPYATAFQVDEVQFVYDPQVYIPFEDKGHKLYDPQVPDYVVTATINAYGTAKADNGEPSIITNTLRFVPKVMLVSYKDLPAIYEGIKAREEQMRGPRNTQFIEMDYLIKHIGDIVEATK